MSRAKCRLVDKAVRRKNISPRKTSRNNRGVTYIAISDSHSHEPLAIGLTLDMPVRATMFGNQLFTWEVVEKENISQVPRNDRHYRKVMFDGF